ncbi:MAG: YbdK family carboxylate-amine ligase [Deltaproteobacteria bacterium]|nr:YbdK family carboxylate-amine ligase [Deltaproteobacteria bacterium]
MTLPFKRSDEPTIGAEVEMQIVDLKTRHQASRVMEILDRVPKSLKERIKPEFLQSTLEVNTEICHDPAQVEANLREFFALTHRIAGKLGLGLLCASTHPISSWKEQIVTPDPRYLRLQEEFQFLGRRLNICGFHVHIGITDGDKAAAILNILRGYLPHLLALSTSSPFWSGYNTGLYSSRINIFQVLPTAGLPPRIKNWREFEKLVEILISTRTIETPREIWWEARPHPLFGTIEVRVCDSPSTIQDMLVLTACIQALVVRLCNLYDKKELPEIPLRQLVEENRWQAARHGFEGYFIDYTTHKTIPIHRAVKNLLQRLRRTAERLGTLSYLEQVDRIFSEGTSAHQQLRVFKRTGSLISVVDDLMEKLKS